MGEKPRPKPSRLAEKLLDIRKRINGGLTQVEMIKRLGFTEEELPQDRISKFERGAMEPNLTVLVAYSEAANCYLEVLARDDLQLGPGSLPYPVKHEGVEIISTSGKGSQAGKRGVGRSSRVKKQLPPTNV
jgi:transcriptional regulator with XRE-family HTH domain